MNVGALLQSLPCRWACSVFRKLAIGQFGCKDRIIFPFLFAHQPQGWKSSLVRMQELRGRLLSLPDEKSETHFSTHAYTKQHMGGRS